MEGILDDSRLDGVFDVRTALRPLRRAELLRTGDVDALLATIELNCQIWGGAGTVLVPSLDGTYEDAYRDELIRSDIDSLNIRSFGEDLEAPDWIDYGMAKPYAALLIADGMDRDKWWPFRVADLQADDPWRPIYAACIGSWPATPSERLFPSPIYDAPPESFDLFFKVEREAIAGSLDDLVERLTGRNTNWPRTLGLLGLASGMRPNTGYIASDRVLPIRDETRTAAGPNIVVVFGDDPVADAALLWNLRGAHAGGYALPIGIPKSEVGRQALESLRKPGLSAAFGFSGGHAYITSTSVPLEELEEIAGLYPGHKAVTFDKLLTFGRAPAIPRVQLATFSNGVARLVPENDADTKLIYPQGRENFGPELQLDVIVDGDHVPYSRSLRGERFWGPRFIAGWASLQVPSSSLRRPPSVRVEWPTTWLRLQCVAQDQGLEVEVSEPGHAALALVDALGGIDQIQWLANPILVAFLYRLAERSGMTWWKGRWTAARKEIDELGIEESAFDELAEKMGRDNVVVAPSGEGRELKFQEFVKALGGKERAATNWIRWAERRHLVVRGTEVTCDKCRARSWIPMTAVPPTVTCSGCGRSIDHPFQPRHLQFSYRLGEVLRRALEMDCLDHLFALRYFHELFKDKGLVGIHPGVNFKEKCAADVKAEADVLLLFADATLVPGEVKRTGAGVTATGITKLEAAADRLASPWSFFAVGQPARDCGSNVPDAAERKAARPRLVVTTDQTFTDYPHWSLRGDPFAWTPISQADEDTRSERFVTHLRKRSPDDPWSSQGSSLLRDWKDDAETEGEAATSTEA